MLSQRPAESAAIAQDGRPRDRAPPRDTSFTNDAAVPARMGSRCRVGRSADALGICSTTRRGVVLAVNGRVVGGARGPGNRGQHGPPAGTGCGTDGAHGLGARRAPATPGPPGGGGCGGRPAPPRGRTIGRHVRAGRLAQIPPRLYLPRWGTCLALYLVLLVGWRRRPFPITGIGLAQRFPPFLGRRATTVEGIVVAGK